MLPPPDDATTRRAGDSAKSEPRSHFLPRTAAGRSAVAAFLLLLALAQPPFVHELANRIEPAVLGMPFLYVYLLVLYIGMIGVLLWAVRRRL